MPRASDIGLSMLFAVPFSRLAADASEVIHSNSGAKKARHEPSQGVQPNPTPDGEVLWRCSQACRCCIRNGCPAVARQR